MNRKYKNIRFVSWQRLYDDEGQSEWIPFQLYILRMDVSGVRVTRSLALYLYLAINKHTGITMKISPFDILLWTF
jgi:hypothetical protein